MTFKTELIKKRRQLEQLNNEIREMEKRCPHSEYHVSLVENFSFEFAPRKKCKLCYTELDGIPSSDEIKQCYKQEFEDIQDREYSNEEIEEFYQHNPLGYNLPRPKIGK